MEQNNQPGHPAPAPRRTFPVVWGVNIGAGLGLAAFSVVAGATVGTPLGLVGDLLVSLVILAAAIALVAGVVALVILGLRLVLRRLGSRSDWSLPAIQVLTLGLRAPWLLFWGFLGGLVFLALSSGDSALWSILLVVSMVFGGLTGWAWNLPGKRRWGILAGGFLVVGALGLGLFFYGADTLAWEPSDRTTVKPLPSPDPGLKGAVHYRFLTYGSGEDLRREEYGRGVSIRTTPVDASLLWSGYTEPLKTYYRQYWGFTPKELPRNARVWLPDGEGPFPLVLIVHGNHNWNEFSDPGYAYLGEHLASRGYLAVSVDENFLNGFALGNPEGRELQARGWLLLKHLELFRDWNGSPQSPFYQKVDLDKVALVGHSNGGEAVAVAAYFNNLESLPGIGFLHFDFHFAIQAVVQLAPSDGVYRPRGEWVSLKDLDYLLLQGGHDTQVMSLSGLGQYGRTTFSPGSPNFKAAVYFYRGNHVNFNTAWGLRDIGGSIGFLINQKPVLGPAEQRQLGKAVITAFLDASLRGDTVYRSWFRDLRRGKPWLPQDIYVHAYQDGTFRPIADFQTGSPSPEALSLGGMATSEGEVKLRFYNKPQNNRALKMSWTDADARRASYALKVPQKLAPSEKEVFTFSLAAVEGRVVWKLELVDRGGQVFGLSLDQIGPVHPPLPTRLFRFPELARALGQVEPEGPETVFQVYEVPLEGIRSSNPAFEPSQLSQVIFRVSSDRAGQAWLDDIGFRESP